LLTGLQPRDLNRLNVIQLAGTKGKVSTSATIASILQKYAPSQETAANKPPRKMGLYTSPHFRSVRERIQINGFLISEEAFTKYFYEIWDHVDTPQTREDGTPTQRRTFFQFMTLLTFHTFIRENVYSAVIETGMGGEIDPSNIVPRPIVTGAVLSIVYY
jgi:folylpolyglutamate synthase